MLGRFENTLGSGNFSGVPVCASYCDSWFEACKNDLTCTENWLDFAANDNSCLVNSNCTTFKELYGNASGLCSKMWGNLFVYSADVNNCTVMKFNSSAPNPNFLLSFPVIVTLATESTTRATIEAVTQATEQTAIQAATPNTIQVVTRATTQVAIQDAIQATTYRAHQVITSIHLFLPVVEIVNLW